MEFKTGEKLGQPALRDEAGRTYGLMEDGLIVFGDVARQLLGEQCQYASRYIDPAFINHPMEQYRHPNLAVGLRVNTDTIDGNYHAYGIHPEDVDEFVGRYNTYRAYNTGWTREENGESRELTREERKELEKYLKEVGAIDS